MSLASVLYLGIREDWRAFDATTSSISLNLGQSARLRYISHRSRFWTLVE